MSRPTRTFVDPLQPNRWIWREELGQPRHPFGTVEAVRHVPLPGSGTGDRPPDRAVERTGPLAAWRRRTSRRHR